MSLGACSGLQPMEMCSADAVSAEDLAEVLTCAQLQSLLCFHMPLHLVDLVEEALELRHESFLRFASDTMPPSLCTTFGQVVGFARPDVVYRETNKRPRPVGW